MCLSHDFSPSPHLPFCAQLTMLRRKWHLRCHSRKIHSRPLRKPGRSLACYLVCKRNSIIRIRSQVGISFEVPERLCRLGGSRKGGSKGFRGHLFECELVTLLIQIVDDFVDAHKTSDEPHTLAVDYLIRA